MNYNFFEIFILSLIQGITEFLPVSSAAHLFLISEIKNFNIQSLLTDVSVHLGSLLAIIYYFRKELSNLIKDKILAKLMILGSIPVIVIGLVCYKTGLINYLRDLHVIAWTTLIFALLLFIADKISVKKKLRTDLNIKTIIIIGLFQILAIIPGVSRSGIVITAGRFLNFDRIDSTKISYYLSIPAISGAAFLSIKDIKFQEKINYLEVITLILFSYLFSYFCIKYLLIFLEKFSFNIFVLYRILISLILFYFISF